MLLKELLNEEEDTLFAELRSAAIRKIDELISSGQTPEDAVDFLRRRSKKIGVSVWKSIYKHYDLDFK